MIVLLLLLLLGIVLVLGRRIPRSIFEFLLEAASDFFSPLQFEGSSCTSFRSIAGSSCLNALLLLGVFVVFASETTLRSLPFCSDGRQMFLVLCSPRGSCIPSAVFTLLAAESLNAAVLLLKTSSFSMSC